MKTTKTLACGVALFFLFVQQTPAQTQNSRARQFYESAVKEKDPDKKIAALHKAVEADPGFVEALYNLALAHKGKQEYGRAEQYLLQANRALPDKAGGDLKVAILYELAAAYNRQGKTKNFEETLRLTKGLASDSQRGATISFELGRFLYQQGRYDEALLELQEGRRLYPARRDYFANLIQLTQTAQETGRLHIAAERAAAKGRLEEAKALLIEIKQKNPADKNVEARLAELDSRLAAEAGTRRLAKLYEQAQQDEADDRLEPAIASYEKLLQTGDYKDAGSRLQKLREQLAQKKVGDEMEAQYLGGIEALKARDWTGALVAFEKVIAQNGGFRDARQRLAEAQEELERENNVARYYADGVAAVSRNDGDAALAAFEKARRLNPQYRDVAVLIAALEKRSPPPREIRVAAATPRLDSLYESASASVNNKEWPQASASLEKLQPNDRDAVDRLAEARANLSAASPTTAVVEAPANHRAIFYIGGFTVLLALPALGFIALSPAARARLHLLRGNYTTAAQTYEKILARHPDRLKLYPPLAKIYLRQNRRDENAMKIYKTILQSNLATGQRDEINAVVAQNFLAEGRNFLTEGRTDVDAIHLLEQALKVEQRRGRS